MISRSRSTAAIMTNNTSDNDKDTTSSSGGHRVPPGGTKSWRYLMHVLVFAVVIYTLLFIFSPSELQEHRRPQNGSYEQLTVVMNTFKRPDMLAGKYFYSPLCALSSRRLLSRRGAGLLLAVRAGQVHLRRLERGAAAQRDLRRQVRPQRAPQGNKTGLLFV